MLIKAGANVNHVNSSDGDLALTRPLAQGIETVVQLLLKALEEEQSVGPVLC